MVNTSPGALPTVRRTTVVLVACYVAVVAATLLALIVLTALRSPLATIEAWVHAVIVGVFAILMPLRLRAARRGSIRGRRAIGIIAGVLVVVNVVEAAIPDLFPIWMRIEMIGIAALMAGILITVIRDRSLRPAAG